MDGTTRRKDSPTRLEHAMNKFEQPMTTHRIGAEGRGSLENFRARRRAFRALHEAGCFVIPNPWDVGSARYLQQLGFPALATTSAGFAFSQGLPDSEGALACERNLAYIADIAGAVDVPVNADFASGYGASPQDVADNVTRCIVAGVAGLSIEDATGDPSSPLYELPLAVERVRAARESVRRLQAFAEAGADVLFAPGPHDPTAIKALVEAVRPKPINVLVVRDSGLSVADIAALGVRRISVGGALALAAWTGFTRAAQKLKSEGSFAGFASLGNYADINGSLVTDSRIRKSDGRGSRAGGLPSKPSGV